MAETEIEKGRERERWKKETKNERWKKTEVKSLLEVVLPTITT